MIMFYLFVGFHGMRIESSAEEILTSRIILLELYLNCIHQKKTFYDFILTISSVCVITLHQICNVEFNTFR